MATWHRSATSTSRLPPRRRGAVPIQSRARPTSHAIVTLLSVERLYRICPLYRKISQTILHNYSTHDMEEDESDNDEEAERPRQARSRPDVRERLQRRKVIQNCAVKTTLRTFSLDDELTREIEACVHGVTRTAIEASRFMNYYVLKLLEEGEDVPKIDQSLLYAAFTTMAGSTLASTVEKFDEALQDYEHLRPPAMERFDCKNPADAQLRREGLSDRLQEPRRAQHQRACGKGVQALLRRPTARL